MKGKPRAARDKGEVSICPLGDLDLWVSRRDTNVDFGMCPECPARERQDLEYGRDITEPCAAGQTKVHPLVPEIWLATENEAGWQGGLGIRSPIKQNALLTLETQNV